ncbi:MAG: ATP-dependent zinc protease [Neptunomonas phycophila]|uniref:putative ATP-dependent zinc protease n=1 Tax=Neptunomonas phycophila TaxID=1572645 RepID=UPI003B8DFCB4
MSELPELVTVQNISFHYSSSNDASFRDIALGNKKGYVVYRLSPKNDNVARFKQGHTSSDDKQSVQDALIFAWAKHPNSLAVNPVAARFISKNRVMNAVQRGVFESAEIGLKPSVIVYGINDNQPFEAKTDTGADMCSMHVDSVQVQGEQVSFVISGRQYQAPLVRTLNVKQADSEGESRPVIKLNMAVGDKTVRDVECNLNNREGMVPLLLGKNFLQQGDFSITVEDVEVMDWDAVDELFEDVEFTDECGDELWSVKQLDEVRNIVESLNNLVNEPKEETDV